MTNLPRAAQLVSAATILILMAALPHAHAQVGPINPAVSVSIDGTDLALGASNSTTITGTVQNTGPVDGTATIAVTVPDGWTAAIDPASAFTLGSGDSAPFIVTLSAPAEATGAATGALAVAATLADAAGRTANADASLALTRVDPPPPPPVPWYATTLGITGIILAILTLAGIAAYVVHRRRSEARRVDDEAAAQAAYLDRETGITLALAGGPLQYGHKRETIYRLALTNASQRPRVALVEAIDVPNGWRASTQIGKIPLSVSETQHVTLVVTPDAVITPGDKATITIRTRPEEAREKDERLHLEVIAPKHGVPTDPHYRIVTVHREGAGQPPVRTR